jgi:tetratricopeptide (TPR) repeat protein
MAYWGWALVLGPNINMPMDAAAEQPAWDALQKAVALAPGASEPERAFIAALAKRYADPSNSKRPTRAAMDSAYADAMREVARRYQDDADAGALFAESMMDLNPWNHWALDGAPAAGTEEIVATLAAVLQKTPDHPGANHFYIHALEASPHPERAVPAAERLGSLVPDAGHLVHMPAHIFHRVGRYNEADDVNVKAARVDSLYIAAHQPEGMYPLMYYPHNVHFVWWSACFAGRSDDALVAAKRLLKMVPPENVTAMPILEFFCPSVMYGYVRFGRWNEILTEPAPPKEWRFTKGMWHFARGFAYNALRQPAKARVELDSVNAIAAATPADAMVSFNSSAALLRLAGHALAGEMAAKRGQITSAVVHFNAAIKEEDALHYDEPPPWFMPVRQQLGAVLLAAGQVKKAEAAYREDLRRFPENGWSLFGLAKCLRARNATAEAAAVERRLAAAWARADVTLTSSRF